MTTPEIIEYRPEAVDPLRRWRIRGIATIAAVLERRPPEEISRVLRVVRRGARPATLDEAEQVRRDVVAASLGCAGRQACLRRSLTVALICRLDGAWPTWCVGVRTIPPFAAHAWVEAEGELVGEPTPPGYFRALLSVGPVRET